MTETTSNAMRHSSEQEAVGNDPATDAGNRTAFRTCPLCEAGCGLEITIRDERVVRIRGDRDDVFSHGFICPKGSMLKQLHDDPDRLRKPMVKRDGGHVEVEWAEAWQEVQRGLSAVIDTSGRESIAVYLGNPSAHSLSAMTFGRTLSQAVGTRQHYSASTVDQMPRQVAAAYVFGTAVSVPVPDLDRTDYLMILGGNPYASNGSLCTAPDFPGRIEAIRARGGKLVVVDPRRSRTAEEADEWLAIRPGTDALLLMAIVHVLFADGLANPGETVGAVLDGLDEMRRLSLPFSPEAVEPAVGIDPATVRRIAHELADAPTSSVYGRIGTTTTEFGTTASWLIDAVNILTGNLDRPGGAMFAMPVAGGASTRGKPGAGRGFRIGRGHSRVRHLPEVMGEFPAAALADEILEPGDGRVRALITVAGNPVLSTPNSTRLDAAVADLDFMVSIDMYLNETTRHANVILPPPSQLQRSHYDVLLLQFAVRNVANYSPATLPLDADQPDEWEVIAKLAMLLRGEGPGADPAVEDDRAIDSMVRRAVDDEHSSVVGRDPKEILDHLTDAGRRGPERLLDFMIRTGPFGDAFGTRSGGATLQLLIDNEHGVDFGALQPRLDEILRTPSGRIELAAAPLVADVARLRSAMDAAAAAAAADDTAPRSQPMVLVGRRHLRSNNSWMHNIELLVKGKPRCTLQVHPDDAVEFGLTDGGYARVTSRVGSVEAPVEVTEAIRPGVVSLPHGWGHGLEGSRMRVAAERAGVNSNVLTDDIAMDPLSGTSVLNGIPVTLDAVGAHRV